MNTAVLLAAGKSRRAGRDKLWADIHGRPLWTLAYETLAGHKLIDQIILVVPKGEEGKFAENFNKKEKIKIVAGGKTRMDSFKAAIKELSVDEKDIVMDHNAANPNVTTKEIDEVIKVAKKYGAAAVSLPAVDTVLKAENGEYKEVLNRNKIRLMQTPQAVRGDFLKSVELGGETDLTSALIKVGPVKVVEADFSNRKITYSHDVNNLTCNSFIGEDSHEFAKSGVLKLGGVKIPTMPGMKANSDGDVVLHAIGRALAQAHDRSFAELADRMCEDGSLDSAQYLKPLLKGVKIYNLSIQIEALRPKIPKASIKKSLAKMLKITDDKIRISAMTGEGLTSFGRGEGIKCTCVITCFR